MEPFPDPPESSQGLLSNWKLVLPLLKDIQDIKVIQTCIETLIDILPPKDLPDLLHTLWFQDYLYHDEKKVQRNCHLLLERISEQYAKELSTILLSSQSDGQFLTFADLDINAFLTESSHHILMKSSSSSSRKFNEEDEGSDIYQKSWYERQKRKLHKFMKQETNSEDVTLAMRYDEEGMKLIDEADLIKRDKKRKAAEMDSTQIEVSRDYRALPMYTSSQLTDETWFARLVRFLVVNLLNDSWEVRCSSILSLEAIIKGFNKACLVDNHAMISLPLHLLEDIVSIGLLVLILDQFIDYDCQYDATLLQKLDRSDHRIHIGFSPVKENIPQMILPAFKLLLDSGNHTYNDHSLMKNKLFKMLVTICQPPNSSWITSLSGILCLVSFYHHFPEFICLEVSRPILLFIVDNLLHQDYLEITSCTFRLLQLFSEHLLLENLPLSIQWIDSQYCEDLVERLNAFFDLMLISCENCEDKVLLEIRWMSIFVLFRLYFHLLAVAKLLLGDENVSVLLKFYQALNRYYQSGSLIVVPLYTLHITQNIVVLNGLFLGQFSQQSRNLHLPNHYLLLRELMTSLLSCSFEFVRSIDDADVISPIDDEENYLQDESNSILRATSANWLTAYIQSRTYHSNIILSIWRFILKLSSTLLPNSMSDVEFIESLLMKKVKEVEQLIPQFPAADVMTKLYQYYDMNGVTYDNVLMSLLNTLYSSTDNGFNNKVGCINNWESYFFEKISTPYAPRIEGQGKIQKESNNSANSGRKQVFVLVSGKSQVTPNAHSSRNPSVKNKIIRESKISDFLYLINLRLLVLNLEEISGLGIQEKQFAFRSSEAINAHSNDENQIIANLTRILNSVGIKNSKTIEEIVVTINIIYPLIADRTVSNINSSDWIEVFSRRLRDAVHYSIPNFSALFMLIEGPKESFIFNSRIILRVLSIMTESVSPKDCEVLSQCFVAQIHLLKNNPFSMYSSACIIQLLLSAALRLSPNKALLVATLKDSWKEIADILLSDKSNSNIEEAEHPVTIRYLLIENLILLGQIHCAEALVRYIALFLHDQVHNSDSTDRKQQYEKQEIALPRKVYYSQLFRDLIKPFANEIAAFCYDAWLSIGIKGFGHYHSLIRTFCIEGFRELVPLAPIGLHFIEKFRMNSSLPLIQQLLARTQPPRLCDSNDPLDVLILGVLSRSSRIFQMNQAPNDPFRSILRPYQWDGISWWTYLRRCGLSGILTDEMGLGKTIQALVCAAIMRIERFIDSLNSSSFASLIIEDIYERLSEYSFSPILIICPAALTLHWQSEIQKFFPSSALLHPVLCNSEYFYSHSKALPISDVHIVSYDTLRNQSKHFQSITWEMIILDEAHLIRNPSIKITQIILQLSSSYRLALSGTPLQNHVEDIWTIIQFLLPDYLGDYPSFRKMYVQPIKKSLNLMKLFQQQHTSKTNDPLPPIMMKQKKGNNLNSSSSSSLTWQGIELLQHLHKQILPFMLRRNKADVLQDLPPKTIIDLICPLFPLQQKMYDDGLVRFQSNTSHATNTSIPLIMTETQLIEQYIENNRKQERKGKETIQVEFVGEPQEDERKVQQENQIFYEEISSSSSQIGMRKNHPKAKLFQFSLLKESAKSGTSSFDNKMEEEKLNPLQLLSYLQSICFHPVSVINQQKHSSYYNMVAASLESSGKFIQLMKVLIDSQIITEEDYSSNHSMEFPSFTLFSKEVERLIEKYAITTEDKDEMIVENTIDEEIPANSSSSEDDDEEEDDEGGERAVQKEKEEILKTVPSAVSVSRKCLIFCKYQQSLDLLESLFFKRYFCKVNYRRLDGSMAPNERFRIAANFNASRIVDDASENTSNLTPIPLFPSHVRPSNSQQTRDKIPKEDEIRILLMTTRSCGLGLNLSAADTVIFLEHDWNPFVDLQAMDRVHRIGQKNPVTVYRLLADASIEKRIQTLQDVKTDIADEVICGKSIQSTENHRQEEKVAGDQQKIFGLQLWESLVTKQLSSR